MPLLAALNTALILVGGLFPYGIPLFTPSIVLFWIVIVIMQKRINVGAWIIPYLLILILYVFPLAIYGEFYAHNEKDLINGIIVVVFFTGVYSVIETRRDLEKYAWYLQIFSTFVATIFAAIGLFKFSLLLKGVKIPLFYRKIGTYPLGTSLISDYNIYGLNLIIGLISLYFFIQKKESLVYRYFLCVAGVIISLALFFSYSRRTWIIFGFLLLFFALSFLKYTTKQITRLFLVGSIKKEVFRNCVLIMMVSASIFAASLKFMGTFEVKHGYHLHNMWRRFSRMGKIHEILASPQSRQAYFEYAGELLEKYRAIDLLIGGGSAYLVDFGLKFEGGGEGYPHNPILSAVLQSGYLGGVIVSCYVGLCGFLYLRCLSFSVGRYFFSIFLVGSFFYFISSNWIISSKIYVFFCLLMPWLIDRIFSKAQG